MKKFIRLWAALGALTLSMTLLTSSPAFAGSMTGATFSAQAPYTYTGTQNNRYDYSFTTATGATLSRLSVALPNTTTGTGTRYLDLNGTQSLNFASTPDAASNSLTGDLDLRVRAFSSGWRPANQQVLAAKWNSGTGQRSYKLMLMPNGELQFLCSPLGTSFRYKTSVQTIPVDAPALWLRVTSVSSTGIFSFFTSTDGTSWAPLGSPQGAGAAGTFDSSAPLELGSTNEGTGELFKGKIYAAELRDGVDGSVVSKFDANQSTQASPMSWIASSGETWTVSRSGTNLPADISSDLATTLVRGIPSTGNATYRMIDNKALYVFPPTSVPSGTAVTLSLSGLTNPSIPGSYSSSLNSQDSGGNPVDSATTNTVAFTLPPNSNGTVAVAVAPTLSFTVSGTSASCNGLANSAGSSSTANAVQLGSISSAVRGAGAQSLSVDSNSANGFKVQLRSASLSSPVLRSQADTSIRITDAVAGPIAAAGAAAFGFTTDDTGLGMASGNGAPVPNASGSSDLVVANTGVFSRTSCVGYFASVSPATPAGIYTTTIIYNAVPAF